MTPGTKTVAFAKDHPAADGHFPSNPIIPGAVLLDEVIAAVTDSNPSASLIVRVAKFFRPVRPGECVDLAWENQSGTVRFECRVHDDLAASGTIEIIRSRP